MGIKINSQRKRAYIYWTSDSKRMGIKINSSIFWHLKIRGFS